MTEFVYTAVHKIHYNTKEPVPLADVISSLEALQGLLKDVPAVLEGITGADVLKSEFFVERVESGSLIEDVPVKLFFKDEAGLDEFIGKIREHGMLRNTLIAVALGGIVTYGLMSIFSATKAAAQTLRQTTTQSSILAPAK
ncbi:hypothetical protein PHO31112_00735 [Pandoraea horticolens]|uniref:Uncharacterized protein n=1 Tax=Pandoraea horticolens TaxID=2508298 RepID=A0A5E4SHU9_9BURK|nr:hypothetical protein [Pandoraea horticolens]VVD74014.1 hypothetical protein PHO31112_00735 [Pandoraea horticolens]